MNIKATETSGKHYATVSQGDRIVFRTAGYVTARMALADARCWVAFHGEKMEKVEMVWVPVSGGAEVELPYADVQKIAIEYNTMRNLSRAGEQYASKRALRPLMVWARETHQLTTGDMAQISRWWWTVDAKARAERARQAVEMIRAQRNA